MQTEIDKVSEFIRKLDDNGEIAFDMLKPSEKTVEFLKRRGVVVIDTELTGLDKEILEWEYVPHVVLAEPRKSGFYVKMFLDSDLKEYEIKCGAIEKIIEQHKITADFLEIYMGIASDLEKKWMRDNSTNPMRIYVQDCNTCLTTAKLLQIKYPEHQPQK